MANQLSYLLDIGVIQSIKDGKSVTIKKGETELTVSSNKEETEE